MACDICGKTHCELHQLAEWLAGGPFSHVCTTCLSGLDKELRLVRAWAISQIKPEIHLYMAAKRKEHNNQQSAKLRGFRLFWARLFGSEAA